MGRQKVKRWPWGWMLFALASCAIVACVQTGQAATEREPFSAHWEASTPAGSVYVLTDHVTGCQYLVIDSKSAVPRYRDSVANADSVTVRGCR